MQVITEQKIMKDLESPEAPLIPTSEEWTHDELRHIPVFIEKLSSTRPKLTGRLKRLVQETITDCDIGWYFSQGENEEKTKLVYRLVHENGELFRDAVKDVVSKWPVATYARASNHFSANDAELVKNHRHMTQFGGNGAAFAMGMTGTLMTALIIYQLHREATAPNSTGVSPLGIACAILYGCASLLAFFEEIRVRIVKRKATEKFERLMEKGDA